MINFKQRIEACLRHVCNTNNKEQNFQGRLYAFLLSLEQEGYIVEMETSIRDEHLKPIFENIDFSQFAKREMDILVYKPDFSEIYAAELKWIYHSEVGWNVFDGLEDYKEDALFCHQLTSIAGFTETCSVVVNDFDDKKRVKSPRLGDVNSGKRLFVGNDYFNPQIGKINSGNKYEDFKWVPLDLRNNNTQDYRYYILSFKNPKYE